MLLLFWLWHYITLKMDVTHDPHCTDCISLNNPLVINLASTRNTGLRGLESILIWREVTINFGNRGKIQATGLLHYFTISTCLSKKQCKSLCRDAWPGAEAVLVNCFSNAKLWKDLLCQFGNSFKNKSLNMLSQHPSSGSYLAWNLMRGSCWLRGTRMKPVKQQPEQRSGATSSMRN